MNKKNLTEADIRTKFITPAIAGEGQKKRDVLTQLLEEHYFTADLLCSKGWDTRLLSEPAAWML